MLTIASSMVRGNAVLLFLMPDLVGASATYSVGG